MPRWDHRLDALAALSASEQLVLEVVRGELNRIRVQLGLAVRTEDDLRAAVRDCLRERSARQEGN